MKLYTENQVRNAIKYATFSENIRFESIVIDFLTPIELPSDGEIMQVALENTNNINEQVSFNNGAVYICKLIEGQFNTKEK